MKLLYILFEEVVPSKGVSKKILSQCDGFRSSGVEVDLFSFKRCNGEFFAVVNDEQIHSYGRNSLKHIRLLLEFEHIINYIKVNHIDIVYVRFSRSCPFSVFLFRTLKKMNVKTLLEIPTYPYDAEKSGAKLLHWKLYLWLLFKIDRITRHLLKYYIDRIVTVQDYDQIFGVPTIKISNAIDLKRIPLRSPDSHSCISFIGVAILADWHAYDRLIEGIGRYYKNEGKEDIHFYIIGENMSVRNRYMAISKDYGIESRIHLEGPKVGVELDSYFDWCDLAIGSLGFHRIGLLEGKPLKCIEYAARGIPFIYSNVNLDFDDKPFTLRVPADESPINIEELLLFLKGLKESPSSIRESIGYKATWDYQMSLVLNEAKTFS